MQLSSMLFVHMQLALLVLLSIFPSYYSNNAVKRPTIMGLVTEESVILASSSELEKNGVRMLGRFDRIKPLNDHTLIALSGDDSDCDMILTQIESVCAQHMLEFGIGNCILLIFLRYIDSHSYYLLRRWRCGGHTSQELSCDEISHYYRKLISSYLKTPSQLRVDALIAGYSFSQQKPILYRCDVVGALQDVAYAGHRKYSISLTNTFM